MRMNKMKTILTKRNWEASRTSGKIKQWQFKFHTIQCDDIKLFLVTEHQPYSQMQIRSAEANQNIKICQLGGHLSNIQAVT